MATLTATIRELDKRLKKVEQQMARYSRSVHSKPAPRKKTETQSPAVRSARRDRSKAVTALDVAQRAGLLAELPPEALARVERWRALPEDERDHILDEFSNLKLDRSLSDIIIENRQ